MIGRMNDFYELGGDSFSAIKIISKVRQKLKIRISIKDINNNSKIFMLSSLIKKIIKKYNESDEYNAYKIKKIKKFNNDEFPITTILSFNTFYKKNINLKKLAFIVKDFNMLCYLKLKNNINIEKINEIFNIIINRHSILKVKFIEKYERNSNGINIYGKIRKDCKINIEKYNSLNFKEFKRPFDITKDILIRVGYIEDKNILMIDLNHIIGDGISYGILKKEIFNLYIGEKLEELPIQYSDYAINYDLEINSNRVLNQLKYYEEFFNRPLHTVNLSNNKNYTENSLNKSYKLKDILIILEKDNYEKINSVLKDYSISKTTFFITIFSITLYIYSGEKELLYCVVNSNRLNEYTENLIGLFAKYTPVLICIENIKLIELIKISMNEILTLFNNDIPLLKLYHKFDIPQPNLFYQYNPYGLEGEDNEDLSNFINIINENEYKELFGMEMKRENDEWKYDMMFVVNEFKDSYEFEFTYNTNLIDENEINKIIRNFFEISIIKNFYTKILKKYHKNLLIK